MFEGFINRREALLVKLLLYMCAGTNHWIICYNPVLKLGEGWFPKEVFFRGGIEPLTMIC